MALYILYWTQCPTISWLSKHSHCTLCQEKILYIFLCLCLNLMLSLWNPVNPPDSAFSLWHFQMSELLLMFFLFPWCFFYHLCTHVWTKGKRFTLLHTHITVPLPSAAQFVHLGLYYPSLFHVMQCLLVTFLFYLLQSMKILLPGSFYCHGKLQHPYTWPFKCLSFSGIGSHISIVWLPMTFSSKLF